MLPVLAAFAALFGTYPTHAECNLRHPALCKTTNDLVWAKDFEPGLKSFAAGIRNNFLGGGRSGPLWEALMATLGGPPDNPTILADGNYLFTACVTHNCTEKGAVVITPSGSIVAAAMLTNHWERENGRSGDLGDSYARLDYFVRTPSTHEPTWYSPIMEWAKTAYAADRAVMDKYNHSLGLTARIWLVSPKAKGLIQLRSAKVL